ncbi:MAG: hypothetical protein U0790_25980 [Isosphaeraceae bacterium]
MSLEQHSQWITWLSRIGYVSLVIWPLVAFTSLFAFDSPGSDRNPLLWLVVGAIWLLPAFLLLAPRFARHALDGGKVGVAYLLVCVPLALIFMPVLAAIVGLIIESVGDRLS